MSHSRIALLVFGVVLIFFQAAQVMAATPTTAAAPPGAPATVCNGKYKGHLKPSAAKLAEILKQHAEWINDGGLKDPKLFNDSRRANLCEADLSGASLAGTDLKSANLTGADLTGAHLSDADLTDAVFDIDLNSLPMVVPGIYAARNLKLVKFNDQQAEAVLVKLRSELKELGLRTQENQLTCAIRRSELNRKEGGIFVHSRFERTINRSAFDWTCEYGASPGRPLIGVLRLTVLFAVIYVFAQYFPGRRGGIWAVWEKDRIDKAEGGDNPHRLISGFPSIRRRGWLRRIPNVFLLAAYFSLLSALRIGWSGLNFGTWISRMQPREYALHATGWVRVVSGLQSLISVYLVELTILTYFGTPFEY